VLAPATKTRAKQAWQGVIDGAAQSQEEMVRRVFAAPLLLRAEVLAYMLTEEHGGTEHPVAALLAFIQEQLAEHPGRYFIGPGPVEALWERLEEGHAGLDQAMAAARALPVTEGLTPAYIEGLMSSLLPMATQPPTWRQARTRGLLVRAAADACERRGEPAFREAYCSSVLLWAHGLLMSVGDGALLREADGLGEEWLRAVTAGGDAVQVCEARSQLAGLWTDPYCAGRSDNFYESEAQVWRLRTDNELHDIDGRPRDDYAMPEPEAALARAMAHWRAARDAQPRNPAVLAGLAETAMWLARFTDEQVAPDAAPAIKLGSQIVADDPARRELKARFRMLAAAFPDDAAFGREASGGAAVAGESRDSAARQSEQADTPATGADDIADLAAVDPDRLAARYGDRAAVMVLQEMIGIAPSAPRDALALFDRQRELLLEPGRLTDSSYRVLCQTFARALQRATGAPGEMQPPPDKDFGEHVAAVLGRLGPDPDPERSAATLVWQAYLSTGVNQEDAGLRLLRLVRQDAPLFARRHEWLIQSAEAVLLTGAGVNAYNARDFPVALRAYLASLGVWLRLGRVESVSELLARLDDIATGADERTAIELTAGLAASVPQIVGTAHGAAVDDQLLQVFSGLLGALAATGSVNSQILWTMLEFAKGLRTAMLLERTGSARLSSDPEATAILERIASRAPGSAVPLTLYRAFENRRQQLLLRDLPAPSLLDLDQARRALDHRTVLLSTITMIEPDRRYFRIAGIFWDDGQALVGSGPLPPELPQQDIPWVPEGVREVLAELTAEGRDHLCVIPDSGLHTAPWHLYGWGDWVFADEWIVTLLPHPHLLFSGRGQLAVVAPARLPVLAIGVADSAAAPDLPPLPDAADEARQIARQLGGRALTGADATEEAIRELAPTARYLHVASHGWFEPTVPSWHALIVQPGESSDGMLTAWEVAELDLRAVRLVTLSACETAKLAVQPGDNIDGLPLAFLSAGARAVIGTQWEIETTVTRRFFEEFYAALGKNDDVRDAFRAAQLTVKGEFPEPGQWAAFYLLGDWR
jgi:CHAT domain